VVCCTDGTTCGAVTWNLYTTATNSVYDVSKNCPGQTCTKCDWWPLRSAAPWYYSPVDCRGAFAWTACNSTCQGSRELYQFQVVVPAANGGSDCQWPHGYVNDTRLGSCLQAPCPTDCEGSWSAWGPCNALCGAGVESSTFTVTKPAANGGQSCAVSDGATKSQACNHWNASCTQVSDDPGACNEATDGTWTYGDCECPGRRPGNFTPNSGVTRCDQLQGEVYTPCPDDVLQVILAPCLGDWVPLEECNTTCGGGSRNSYYNVTSAGGMCGTCSITNGTIRDFTCNTQPCPINCTGNWTDWGACNATCGGGNNSRQFQITTDAMYGGANCTAANGTVEWQQCNTQPCPINCTGNWTEWGACNVTCGAGNQSREFQVVAEAMYGGANCTAANRTVEWQACSMSPCPINCTGNWTDWGACNATCGGGNHSREFQVVTEAMYGGANCTAANGTLEWQACNTQPCPINCTGNWTDWGACNVTCGAGNQSREFQVVTQAMHGGANCTAANHTVEWQACSMPPCPINCTGNWTDWDACNATCGGGNHSREFQVVTQAMYGGANCTAANGTLEWQECNTQPCPINCTGNWTEWGACNVTCGAGNQSREFQVVAEAMYGGENCTAANGTVEWQACSMSPCPINCTGNWTDWGACNATCGAGNHSREFQVVTRAMYGGANCTAADGTLEWQECNTQPCPINCTGNWTDWGACNVTCGAGNHSREFQISAGAMHGGENCTAANGTVEWHACSMSPCPINCTGNWTDWGVCNVNCGGGNHSKEFQVVTEAMYGGANCTAANGTLEWQECNTQPCPINCTGNWTDWGACNVTCGAGNHSREFQISADAMHGGENCTAANGTVEWQACSMSPCPINCTGNWTDWGACNVTCGAGNHSREFQISADAMHGGANCTAANGTLEWQACNTQPCPINCTGNWTDWGACNVTCGAGNHSREFQISAGAMHGGANCTAANGTVEWQACSMPSCPINCTGNWTDWDACNATCGGGNQSRVFVVTTEAMHGGQNCSVANATTELRECNTQPCPINCIGNWTAWGACNATCGGGNQSRLYIITTEAAYGGTNCSLVNSTIEWRECNTNSCPVNCIGDWSQWGSCNATCGGGQRSRVFHITEPQAHGGGCPAANGTVQWQACNSAVCPVNVNCSGTWNAWGSCNVTCGGGNRSRTFTVTAPASGVGNACEATQGQIQSEACNTQACPPPPPSPSPQLGVCEVPKLLPVLYVPKGTLTPRLPALVMFPSAESKDLYCPFNATAGAAMCTVRLQASPVLMPTDTSSLGLPPQSVVQQVECVSITLLTCQVTLNLGPDAAQYDIELQPVSSTATVCNQPVTLQVVGAQVSCLP